MPYLTNQEGLNHESNFDRFYTQEGVQSNCNWANIFTEQEVMNFTIQRFINPSICEYPTLEEDSSSIKERPEAKPIIGVKRGLSAFQKAQDQEKWPRKLGVMINSPEPAKPTSSMESLQPIQLGSTQSYLWEPGDHLNQSGGIPERFLNPSICEYPTLEEDSSSIKERPEAKPIIGVKRSLSDFQKAQDQEKWPRKLGVMINSTEPAKPTSSMENLQPIQLGSTQSYLWEPGDHLNQSGAIPIQPGEPDDVQTKPRHPGDIIHEPEEFYNFIPCTSPHRNKKIPIITKLPYLESQALKLQQLLFLQSMHDISTFQTIKKIPRKLT
ncbi:hypothetical protein F2Q69_00051056 [Brassica cretica]|uniref:Uncharacterized protein n=1 Tax=Brassica cretica TaxID=69181 RepID=A0A8S9PTR6_BRACR|nr:hypothetical protein F2Q69_00051056 [Brassica cretica]